MPLVLQLVAYGLRQVIGDPADAIVNAVVTRLTNHSQTLPKALASANDRAWQALGIALAGDGFLDQVKVFFADGMDKGVREQVRAFLNSGAVPFSGAPADFRKKCLAELTKARKDGLLSADRLNPNETARQTAVWQRFSDPHSLIDGAARAVAAVASALAPSCPNLALLLKEPVPGGPPLLAAAFAYFLRREVEMNDELANGLLFDGLRQLSAAQTKAFGEAQSALEKLGPRFDDILGGIGQIGADVHALGAKLDHLSQQIEQLASRNNVQTGELKPQFEITINNEHERALARALLAEVRKLPPEVRKADDLSRLGDVLRAAGLFQDAKQSYAEAAGRSPDQSRQAANHYKEYLTALEQKQWDQALTAVLRAAALDKRLFAPFPLQKYEPKRILGAGGFGAAFLCHDRFMNRDVVVKSLHAADLERHVTDVFKEAQALLDLSHTHPSIIGVRDCSYADLTTGTRPYIVMDYFPGGSLETFVRQRGVLSSDDLTAVARQIAGAMHAAHERGILHRDLKPENVLVRKEGPNWQVRIIDFGLAVRTQVVQASSSRLAPERTLLGESAGTARYAPPEQMGELPGVAPGPYSDVFAFGKLCLFSLFKVTESTDRLWKELPSHGRTKLKNLVERCIERDLTYRFPSFDPVIEALEGRRGGRRLKSKDSDEERRAAWEAEQQRLIEARRQHTRDEAEQARLREEQARLDAQRREAEERKRLQDEQARVQQEAETQLAELLRSVFDRTKGRPAAEDERAAVRLCKQLHIREDRANQIVREVREQWHRKLAPLAVPAVGASIQFALIPAGSFLMGSPRREKERGSDEVPHPVRLTRPFHLAIHQVTQTQWKAVMGDNPSRFLGDDLPVESVSWQGAVEFCKRFSERDGKTYRLPTEAEWEYACRAGTTTAFHFGESLSTDQANYDGNYVYGQGTQGAYRQHTTPVGSFAANAWGLLDMHGNVCEWCIDWYGPYPSGEAINPLGPRDGQARVARGGSSFGEPRFCRSASRGWFAPTEAINRIGFRVCLHGDG